MRFCAAVLIVLLALCSCKDAAPALPKPRTYPRIIFPEKNFQEFAESYCNFNFQMPGYSRVEKDEFFFDEVPVHPCWFDIVTDTLNGRLHCSYYPVRDRAKLDSLVADAFAMISKHRGRSNFIEEIPIQTENGVSGIFFELSGPVASPYQFFLTDSTQHFLRAAMYFNNPPNPDSMQIVHEFVREDLVQMIDSFRWE